MKRYTYRFYRDSDGAILKVGRFSHLAYVTNGPNPVALAMFKCWRRPHRSKSFVRAGYVSDWTLSVLEKVHRKAAK
jgi:hypothetical protein